MGHVYQIKNNITNKVYVGATNRSVRERYLEHLQEAKEGSQKPIHKALREFGVDNFSISVLEECDPSRLDEREVYWIEQKNSFRNGYNSTYGGKGKHNVDYDEILRLYNKEGKSEREIMKITGYSTDTISAVLNDFTNITIKERRDRVRYIFAKPVYQINLSTGEILACYPSIKEAAKTTGVLDFHITDVCRGKRKSTGGYGWKFVNPDQA